MPTLDEVVSGPPGKVWTIDGKQMNRVQAIAALQTKQKQEQQLKDSMKAYYQKNKPDLSGIPGGGPGPPSRPTEIGEPAPTVAEATQAKDKIDKKLDEIVRGTDTWEVDGKEMSRVQTISYLQSDKKDIQKYIDARKKLDTSFDRLNELSNYYGYGNYDTGVDTEGNIKMLPPKDIPPEVQVLIETQAAPPGTEFTDGKGNTISKEKAVALAKEGYDVYIHYLASKKYKDALSTVGMMFRPGVAPSLFVEAKEKLAYQWSKWFGTPVEQNLQLNRAYEAQERKYRLQGQVLKEFSDVQKDGSWQAYAGFFATEIEMGAALIASYGIGYAVGRVSGTISSFLKARGITTIAKVSTTTWATVAKIGLYVGMGTVVAPSVISNVKTIYDTDKEIKALDKKYDKKISEAKTDTERKRINREKYFEQESLYKQQYSAITSLTNIGITLMVAHKYGQEGFKKGQSISEHKAFIKQFAKGSPKYIKAKYGLKAMRLMEKVKSGYYRPLKSTRFIPERATARAMGIAKQYKLVMGGSGASYQQVKDFRLPRDIDFYAPGSKGQAFRAKSSLKSTGYKFDVHGPKFYQPEGYYNLGVWTQKPIYVGGVRTVPSGELMARKGVLTMRGMAGTGEPWRIAKDVPDFYAHMESQISSAKSSWSPFTKAKGYLAEKYWSYYKQPSIVMKTTPTPKFTRIPTTPKISTTTTKIVDIAPKIPTAGGYKYYPYYSVGAPKIAVSGYYPTKGAKTYPIASTPKFTPVSVYKPTKRKTKIVPTYAPKTSGPKETERPYPIYPKTPTIPKPVSPKYPTSPKTPHVPVIGPVLSRSTKELRFEPEEERKKQREKKRTEARQKYRQRQFQIKPFKWKVMSQ